MRAPILCAVVLAAASASAQPMVSSVTPASGLTTGLTYVHLHGTGLKVVNLSCPPLVCDSLVKFGDQFGAIVDSSNTELVVLAPPHIAGVVDIQVHLAGNGDVTVAQGYRYQAPAADDMVRLLVPVAISAGGAFGTDWHTEFLVSNGNSEPLGLAGASTPPGGSDVTVPSLATVNVALHPPAGNTGAFVYVPRRLAANVTTSLRVHDTTRDADNWGADIPVVPETQFKRVVVLAGVPSDPRYRTLLRLYGYSGDTSLRVYLRDDTTGELLKTLDAGLTTGLPVVGSNQPPAPAYGGISLDAILAPFAAAHPRFRVEVGPTSDLQAPIWGFISITNNTTQQVTTITPSMSHPTLVGGQATITH